MGLALWEPVSPEPSGPWRLRSEAEVFWCPCLPTWLSLFTSIHSLLCHPGGQPRRLPGLVDRRWLRSQLRPGPGVAVALLPLRLRVLVPACLQGLPVSGGMVSALWGVRASPMVDRGLKLISPDTAQPQSSAVCRSPHPGPVPGLPLLPWPRC